MKGREQEIGGAAVSRRAPGNTASLLRQIRLNSLLAFSKIYLILWRLEKPVAKFGTKL